MIFQQMELGPSLIPHFHVILTGQSISEIILIIQDHLQGPKVFRGKSIYSIILGIQCHLQGRKANSKVKMLKNNNFREEK